ncbi:hypothetical protein HJG53_05155 [Sphingomonas sp. ID1715]|uniref:hypothetical protein n=1 Tax=Sphingomonas sp. ID1715 TaxID=1656898 RepID=UPI001489ACC6|nr:hypothetical protein [Sphingomonas sp. ID1715]NNM76289.1 hypothetical protein [Sphingomonas sp. ID1715]
MNAKPLASLTSGLLARKGTAKPAMRPQGFAGFGHRQEDLGWNDMGFDAPQPVAEPPVVVRQQEDLAVRLANVEATPRAAPGTARDKAAFTLRLDGDRHLRLRLASAVRHRSSQQLVTEALDALLAGMPELDELVAQAKSRSKGN